MKMKNKTATLVSLALLLTAVMFAPMKLNAAACGGHNAGSSIELYNALQCDSSGCVINLGRVATKR